MRLAILLLSYLTLVTPALPVERTLTIVVGFAPGGTSDVAARQIAEVLRRSAHAQQVIVVNRSGGGGRLAADMVKRVGGNTLLLMSSTSALRVPPSEDLLPIAPIASFEYVAAVEKKNTGGIWLALSDYFRAARQDPRLRSVATAGAGSFPHLIGSRLFRTWGVQMNHVPYDGSNPAVMSLLGGHVGMAIVPYPDYRPLAESKAIQIIARGGSGIEERGWLGIFAPKGTTRGEADRLANMLRFSSEASREKLQELGLEQAVGSADDLATLHMRSYKQWKPELELLGITF